MVIAERRCRTAIERPLFGEVRTPISAFLSQHAIDPVIDRVFKFEEVALAYDHLRGARHVGKIVVRVASAAG